MPDKAIPSTNVFCAKKNIIKIGGIIIAEAAKTQRNGNIKTKAQAINAK
ncbi:MAG: hypothetical protein P9M01_03410 [Candidatus Kappaea frigidicola]|nr:hypothetical protein [Candidatus Kappaea frigidicola]